jgi:putative ABC transport system permease protein
MILRYVLRTLARRRMRALMGVLGVFCTLALLTAVRAGLDSVSLAALDVVSLQAGRADVVLRREGSEWHQPRAFDPAEALAKLPPGHPFAGFAPRLLGIRPVGGELRFALVVGIDPARERELGVDGFRPEPVLAPGACWVSRTLEKQAVGSRLKLGKADLEVRGVLERQFVFPQSVRDFVVADLATARQVLGEEPGVHVLAGSLRDPGAYYDARDLGKSVRALKDAGEALAEALGPDYAVTLPRAEAVRFFDQAGGPLRAVFGVLAGVALAITALLVYSLVSVSVEERIREHAILRTLGARRSHVFGLVLTESAVVCLGGVVPGVFAGLLLAKGLVALFGLSRGGGADTVSLAVSPDTVVFGLVAGIVVAVGSAILPALRATRGRIVDGLDPLRRGRLAEAPPEGSGSRGLLLAGLALSCISGTVFFLLPSAVLSGDPSLIGAVALGLLVVILLGFVLVALAAAPAAERAVLAVLGFCFGPAAELASRNLGRHRRRNATTSLLFALSVSFVLFLAGLGTLASRLSLGMIDRRLGADLRIDLPAGSDLAAEESLGKIEGVERVVRASHLRGRTRRGISYEVVAADLVGMKRLWVMPFGVGPEFAEAAYVDRIVWSEGGPEALAKLSVQVGAEEPAPAIVSLSLARHLEVGKGDLLRLDFHLGGERREARVRIEAVCASVPGFLSFRARSGNAQGSGLLVPANAFAVWTEGAPEEARDGFCLAKAPGVDVASRVRDRLGLRYRLGVQSAAEERREAEGLYWATQVFFALLLWAATAIALFGLVAAMASAAIERRWEIGVLKAVGLRRRELYRMFAAEATAVTLSSGFLGAGMGYLLAWLFAAQAAAFLEMNVPVAVPWITVAATFVVCSLAGLLASWLPTRRLLGRPVAEILRGS